MSARTHPPPPEKEPPATLDGEAGSCLHYEATEKALPDAGDSDSRFAQGQVRVIVDDRRAKAIAVRAGVGLMLAAVPPRREGAALAVGRIDSLAVLALRFFGWESGRDNGWVCVIGSPDAVHEIAETIAHSITVPSTIRDLAGGLHRC